MRVRMRIAISGTRDGVHWPPRGGEMDLPDSEAAGMCARGWAEPVAVRAEAEKAVPSADVEKRTPSPSRQPRTRKAKPAQK